MPQFRNETTHEIRVLYKYKEHMKTNLKHFNNPNEFQQKYLKKVTTKYILFILKIYILE